MEDLKKSLNKIEVKANDRKVCIKKLYNLLEEKEGEID
jgi:hypothetical protein